MMNVIVAFWRYERRKFFSKKYVAGFLALLAIVLAFHQYNTLEYKNTLAQVDSFKDFEYKKVDQFFNYRIYSTYGFRLMFQPAPLSIFFNNSVTVSDLNAFADGGERFYIYKPVYGKKIFDLKKNWVSDFSEIIMLIGGLLVLFYGCFALANMEYLRFLTSIAGKRKLFWGLYAARAIWILTGLLVITACSFLLILFN
ncbi:MAG TPA: hypothetical protein VK469_17125, partial [Candidatus Kapabacteria bacterium]|nr:hypothetical protein [Candidatus Kapabacteria bacterium]